MKKFEAQRELEEIFSIATEKGYEVDKKEYLNGSDYIWLEKVGHPIVIAYNTFNGLFSVHSLISNTIIATNTSEHLDNVDWYVEILEMFYLEEKEEN